MKFQNPSFVFHLNPSIKYQTIRYFGESACWWSPVVGHTEAGEKILQLLHTKAGLNLNVLRLNIGASVKEDRSDAPYPDYSLKMRAPYSPLCEDGSYDISRDIGMLTFALKAKDLGTIDDFTLFMNSPPSCMTANGKTCETSTGIKDVFISNLPRDKYEAYAAYVADVTKLYLDAGIPVKYVSPINEPQWPWDQGHQEGCHYSPDEALEFYRTVVQVFNDRAATDTAMQNVKISMPESAQWAYPEEYTFGLYEKILSDPTLSAHIDHFSAHSYEAKADKKRQFKTYTERFPSKIPLHQTEWGPMHNDASHPMEYALELANTLYEDLTILNVPHWTWWTGLAGFGYPSGLIDGNWDGTGLVLTKRYYVMMHHSRFIRDYTRVELTPNEDQNTVVGSAYVSETGNGTAIILINNSTEEQVVSLSGNIPSDKCHLYLTDKTFDCADQGLVSTEMISLPPLSVATVTFGNITLEGVSK